MSKILNDLQHFLEQDDLNKDAVVSMMVSVRKLLEGQKLQKDYPFLMLYCNWIVHPAIDREEYYVKLLENLTDVLINLPYIKKWKETDDGGFIWNADEAMCIEVNKSLGISDLRQEFVKLFTDQNLSVSRFQNTEKWRRFCETLSWNLVEQVIKFPDVPKKDIKVIFDSIEAKAEKDKQVIKFSLVPSSQIPDRMRLSRNKSVDIFFQMETSSGIYFVGPFWISELAM